MRIFIVDTSALVRLYIPDGPVPEMMEESVDLAWRAEALLKIPELALAEAAGVLRKKEKSGFISQKESGEVLDEILKLPLETVGHRNLLKEAVAIARSYDITAYDALFIALALREQGELITADAVLEKTFNRALKNIQG